MISVNSILIIQLCPFIFTSINLRFMLSPCIYPVCCQPACSSTQWSFRMFPLRETFKVDSISVHWLTKWKFSGTHFNQQLLEDEKSSKLLMNNINNPDRPFTDTMWCSSVPCCNASWWAAGFLPRMSCSGTAGAAQARPRGTARPQGNHSPERRSEAAGPRRASPGSLCRSRSPGDPHWSETPG